MSNIVVVGGTSGLGHRIAERAAARGDEVVITGRDAANARRVAEAIGGRTRGIALDLARPQGIAGALESISEVDHLVITATEQNVSRVLELDIEAAIRVVTVKLVGYAETVRALHSRLRSGAAIVLFGGLAKDRPYPGSTMVTAFNGGIASLVRTLAVELAPVRVNAIHPGLVGDSPKWRNVPTQAVVARTPLGRLVTMDEIADTTEFLLRNTGISAQNLSVDGGWLAT